MGLFKFFGLEEKAEKVEEVKVEEVEKGNVFCGGCKYHSIYSSDFGRLNETAVCCATTKSIVHPKTYYHDEYTTFAVEFIRCTDRNQDNNCTLFEQKRKPITKKRGK
jgi:hypothetical protein